MSVCAQANRRRRQAANNFRHMSPMTRPHYSKRSAETAAKRLAGVIAKQKLMAARKGASKK